jgi:hypothetical protein
MAESEVQMKVFADTGPVGALTKKEYFRKDCSRACMRSAGRDLGDGTIVEIAIDMSDRKYAEAALRESQARSGQISESSS